MVLLEQLRIHVGGIVLLRDELYWYGGRGWDGCPGRICLLMDSAPTTDRAELLGLGAVFCAELLGLGAVFCAEKHFEAGARTAATHAAARSAAAAALLLLDGCPCWVWIGPDDLELL
jgi:hypothetical protein